MPASAPQPKTSLDLVQVRDLLAQLIDKKDNDALLEIVFGVLQKAEKVIEEKDLEIRLLKKQIYGRKSEKISPDQLGLFASVLDQMLEQQQQQQQQEEGHEAKEAPKKKRKHKTPRRPLEPTRSEKIPVAEDARVCGTCGDRCATTDWKRSLVIEHIPAKIEVIEYLRELVACSRCQGPTTVAPVPKERVIDNALPGPNLLAQLTVNKAVDGLPLNRTQKSFKRAGLDIPIQTLNRWEDFAHRLLEPVTARLRELVLSCDTINLDDTGLRVRDKKLKGRCLKGHIWTFVGRRYDPAGDLAKTQEFVFYTFAKDWKAEHPETFLEDFRGTLQGDAYRGFEKIADENRGDHIKRLLAGCWMHARRPFVQSLEARDPSSIFFVQRLQEVYQLEAQARRSAMSLEERFELRQNKSLPLLYELRDRAEKLSPLPLSKPLKNGVSYLLNQWDKLLVPFTSDPRLDIDNGCAERRLRRVASGRKTWLFAGSERGAERFANLLSLVSSAEAFCLEPGGYIADILSAIDTWPYKKLDDLLPHRWRAHLESTLD